MPVGLAVVLIMGRNSDLLRVFKTPRLFLLMFITGLLITGNWTVYVWAIAAEKTLETSLGYFINPLFNVVLGYFLLGERLSTWQRMAVMIATLAVGVQTFAVGHFPWVAISLALLFSTYGYIRKTVDIGPVQGFVAETIIMLPVGFGLAWWFFSAGNISFGQSWSDSLLLLACGPVTAAPLILFAAAARRLAYSTIGILQYIAPSMMFLIAVFVFHEPMDLWKFVSFVMIWLALAIYTIDSLRQAPDHT